jgi:hypothetical protein
LEIPPKYFQIFDKYGWNIENIKNITMSDLKELGIKPQNEKVFFNWCCNYDKNYSIFLKRRKEQRFI